MYSREPSSAVWKYFKLPKSDSTVKGILKEKFIATNELIFSILSKAKSKFTICADIWTQLGMRYYYLGATCHLVSENFKPKKYVYIRLIVIGNQ